MDSEIIDISNLNDDLNQLKSVNFGGGIELLMNDKVKDGKSKSSGYGNDNDINIDDLNKLENELNELSDVTSFNIDSGSSSYSPKSDIFSASSTNDRPSLGVRFDDNTTSSSRPEPSISIGKSTAETGDANSKTWDGFSKFNNVPIGNPDKTVPIQPAMSKEELLREKFKYLRKLEALEKKGVELSKKYNMDSPLAEMQGEYETIMEEKTKQNSIKFQGNMMMAVINGIEFLNNKFDPFDIKLDGWSEQINENINDYDEIFAELYEKYKSKATMAPELKLMFQLGGSALMLHMTNTMFKSSMPGMDDIMRQNPDLMRQFQNAAVNSMGQSNPGFGGFMSGLMNPEPDIPMGREPPPPPMATQGPNSMPYMGGRPGNNNSMNMGSGMGRSSIPNMNDGINIRENQSNPVNIERTPRRPPQQPSQSSNQRPEMKGPSDISEILSGLKTKTINIQEQSQQQQQPQLPLQMDPDSVSINNDSTISISDLKELQGSGSGNMPKRSRRKPRSDKNTISLDI
uniref:Uncharacterized protein n=1 Tax=viral metagenome TaxID=1070528 RepID=A0A6C0E860_9ZZZZ